MTSSAKVPPGNKDAPIVQAMDLASDPVTYIRDLHQKYPDGYSLSTGILPDIHYLTKPGDIHQLQGQSLHLSAGKTNSEVGFFDIAFGDHSVVVLDGEKYNRSARWIRQALGVDDLLKSLSHSGNSLRNEFANWPRDARFNLYPAVRRIAAGVITDIVLDATDSDRTILVSALIALMDSIDQPVKWLVKRRSHMKVIDRIINRYIFRRRESPGQDVLSRLIANMDSWVTDKDIRHNVLTLLILGHEGVSAAVTWGLFYVYRDKEIYKAIEAEAKWLATKSDLTTSDLEQIPGLIFLKKETLRLSPPLISVHRRNQCPVDAGKWTFSRGSSIGACMLFAHRDKDCWENEDQFSLYRFKDASPQAGSYFPFGLAPRSCMGEQLAGFEFPLLVAKFMNEFGDRVQIMEEENPELGLRGNILTPKRGMPIVISS